MSGSVSGYDFHAMFPQVEVEGGHHSHDVIKIIEGVIKDKVPLSKEHVAKINQNAFWKLSKVTDMGGKPLKSGPYAIQNAENGPITRGLAAPESNAPVVSSSIPAYVSYVVQSIPSNNRRLDSGESIELEGMNTRSHSSEILRQPRVTQDQRTN